MPTALIDRSMGGRGAVMHCPACGVDVIEAAVYCHRCGERLAGQGGQPPAQTSTSPAEAFRHAAGRSEDVNRPESELWRGGYSPKAMLGAWLLCAAISLVVLAVGIVWAKNEVWWFVLAILMCAPWLYALALLGYRRISVRYALTSQRFMHESGVLRRINDRIEVIDMDDISFEQGLLERLIGVGTIRIVSSDRSHPDMTLPGIDNVKEVAGMFDDARRSERRRRGLFVEQV